MSPKFSLRYYPLIALSLVHLLAAPNEGVIVDGSKKKELSAIKNQKSDPKTTIDPFNTKDCGISDPNSEDHEFISMAREGQFPWMASLQIKYLQDSNPKAEQKEQAVTLKVQQGPASQQSEVHKKKMEDLHFCSGFFISDRWVLSAAHCFVDDSIKKYYNNDKLKIVAGSHKVSSRNRLNKNITIERIYYHGKFNRSMPIGYDIALVELTEPVHFSSKRKQDEFGEQKAPYINSICLPVEGKKYSSNETARIAGWGLSSAKDTSSMPSKLLTTDILVGDEDKCVEAYKKALKSDEPEEQRQKEDDFICASYKNSRDACQSDSGGPLMMYVDYKAVAVGIVSYGLGCATKGVPGVYTRTSAYIDWIKEITTKGPSAEVSFKIFERSKGDKPKVIQHHEKTTTKKPTQPSKEDQSTTTHPPSSSRPSTSTSSPEVHTTPKTPSGSKRASLRHKHSDK